MCIAQSHCTIIVTLITVITSVCMPTISFAEVIELHDGTTIVGPILNMTSDDVTVDSSELGQVKVRRTSMKSINGSAIETSASSANGSPSPSISISNAARGAERIRGNVGIGVSYFRTKTPSSLDSFSGPSVGTSLHWQLASFRMPHNLTAALIADAWKSLDRYEIQRQFGGVAAGLGWESQDNSNDGGGQISVMFTAGYGTLSSRQGNYTVEHSLTNQEPYYAGMNYDFHGAATLTNSGMIYGSTAAFTHHTQNNLGYFIGTSFAAGTLIENKIDGPACTLGAAYDKNKSCESAPVALIGSSIYTGLAYKF